MKKYSIILLAALLAACQPAGQKDLENVNAAIDETKAELAPDARQVVYEISAYLSNDSLIVAGATSEQAVRDALVEKLNEAGISFYDEITVLPADSWALTRIPAASHRVAGRHGAEMATQSVLGTPLRVLEEGDDWWRVQTPDGYIAYVPSSSVVAKTPEEMEQWRASKRFIVTSPYQIRVYRTADSEGVRNVVTDLVTGCIVTAAGGELSVKGGKLHVELPDGRTGYVAASYITPIEEWAAQDFNPEQILDQAYSMEGSPYLWGGTSVKAIDCSGLAKVSYYSNGYILMRDASQQALTGTRIEADDWRSCRAGDLLFFGNAETKKVTHVAIYDHDGNYVHSSGRVKRNSVDPESPDYLSTPFLHAVRINGNEGTAGIVQARNHPWYFSK